MQKKSWVFTLFSLLLAILLFPAEALALDPPEIDEIPEFVDADTYLVTGTTEPFAQVYVAGGLSLIVPVTAESSGYFEIYVPLAQDKVNIFQFSAVKDNEISDYVTITITEDKEKAEELLEDGTDVIAPEPPELDEYETEVDAESITLTGSGEEEAYIVVINSKNETFMDEIDDDGKFEIEVALEKNAENTFKVYVKDKTGNISTSVNVAVTEGDPSLEPQISDPFTDIDGHWGYDFIENLRLEGVISGYGDGTFGPNNQITRAEITKIALSTFEFEISDYVPANPFPDVDKTAWYAKYIQTAKEAQVIGGYNDGTFKPNNNVSRAEALKILLVASEIDTGTSTEDEFTDTASNAWYANYISYAVENGIIEGYNDNTFKPDLNITRAEICKIAVKVLELKNALRRIPTI